MYAFILYYTAKDKRQYKALIILPTPTLNLVVAMEELARATSCDACKEYALDTLLSWIPYKSRVDAIHRFGVKAFREPIFSNYADGWSVTVDNI